MIIFMIVAHFYEHLRVWREYIALIGSSTYPLFLEIAVMVVKICQSFLVVLCPFLCNSSRISASNFSLYTTPIGSDLSSDLFE